MLEIYKIAIKIIPRLEDNIKKISQKVVPLTVGGEGRLGGGGTLKKLKN